MSVNLLLESGSKRPKWWWWWRWLPHMKTHYPGRSQESVCGRRISRTTNVFLISLTQRLSAGLFGRGVGWGDLGGGGSSGGSQWLLNQTMGYRVPLVLSGIPLLPGESPEPLSVDGTASEVKGGVACVRACVWCVCVFTQQLVLVPPLNCRKQRPAHQLPSILMCVCLFSLKILQILLGPKASTVEAISPSSNSFLKVFAQIKVENKSCWTHNHLLVFKLLIINVVNNNWCMCIAINILKKYHREVGSVIKGERSKNVPVRLNWICLFVACSFRRTLFCM